MEIKSVLFGAAASMALIAGAAIAILPKPQLTKAPRQVPSETSESAPPTKAIAIVSMPTECAPYTVEEKDIFQRLRDKDRSAFISDLKSGTRDRCEKLLDILDLVQDPDRTSPGHECRYTKGELRALQSLRATAQIPLLAHMCWFQEAVLANLAKIPADDRDLALLQMETYHREQFEGYAASEVVADARHGHDSLR